MVHDVTVWTAKEHHSKRSPPQTCTVPSLTAAHHLLPPLTGNYGNASRWIRVTRHRMVAWNPTSSPSTLVGPFQHSTPTITFPFLDGTRQGIVSWRYCRYCLQGQVFVWQLMMKSIPFNSASVADSNGIIISTPLSTNICSCTLQNRIDCRHF